MPNDPTDYPENLFANMTKTAKRFAYPFPYLINSTQAVAKAYGAVCTPDFFGYNAELRLQYRGRLDDSKREKGLSDLLKWVLYGIGYVRIYENTNQA